MTRRQKRLHPNIAAFFTGAAVVFDREVGYQDVIDGIVHIGGEKPDDTIHEMCHFVEIDEARMDKPIWGMNFGIWVPTPGNRYSCGFHEYFGTADIEREMRVIAWHANVTEAIGVKSNLSTWIRALSFVPG